MLDYDMTLMNTLIDFFEAVNAALERYGAPRLDYGEFYRRFLEDRLGEIVPRGVDPAEFWRFFRRVYSTRHGYPSDGAEYMLRMLRHRGSEIVIVTGRENCRLQLLDELRRFGLHDYIDEVYSMMDLYRLEGDEEELFDKSWLISYILEKRGYSPRDAVAIGDYIQDYRSAEKAGVEFIGYAPYPERRSLLRKRGVKHLASTLYEIPYILYLIGLDREK